MNNPLPTREERDARNREQDLTVLARVEEKLAQLRATVEGGGRLTYLTLNALSTDEFVAVSVADGQAGLSLMSVHMQTLAMKTTNEVRNHAQHLYSQDDEPASAAGYTVQ